VSEGKVLNKLFEGSWKYYHQASKIVMTTENYKTESWRFTICFYPNGKIAEETSYKNNLKEGFKKFTENGIVLEETIFQNNEYNGWQF
jgi:antitoxin component YwqK of YwqJK toxin-antitoxin module